MRKKEGLGYNYCRGLPDIGKKEKKPLPLSVSLLFLVTGFIIGDVFNMAYYPNLYKFCFYAAIVATIALFCVFFYIVISGDLEEYEESRR